MLYEKPRMEISIFEGLDVIRTSMSTDQGGSFGGDYEVDGASNEYNY